MTASTTSTTTATSRCSCTEDGTGASPMTEGKAMRPYLVIVGPNRQHAYRFVAHMVEFYRVNYILMPVSPDDMSAVRGIRLRHQYGDRIMYLPKWWRTQLQYHTVMGSLMTLTWVPGAPHATGDMTDYVYLPDHELEKFRVGVASLEGSA